MNVLTPLLFLMMWSSGAFFVKLGLMNSSVWTFLALRSIGATLVLALVLAIGFRSDLHAALLLPRRTILSAVFVGLLLQAGYQGAYFLAIANGLSPGALTIVLGAQPLLMPWIAREKMPREGKALLLAGFLGLILAVIGMCEPGDGSFLGLIFGAIALSAVSAGTALQKRIELPIARSILWQYAGSVVVFTAIASLTGWQAAPNASFLVSAAWMILVVSVGANVLLLYMMSRYQVSKVGIIFYFVPIVTMIGEHYLYRTTQSAKTMIGAAVVVVSSLAFAKLDRLLPYLRNRLAQRP